MLKKANNSVETEEPVVGDLSNFDGDAFFDSLIEEFEGQADYDVTFDQTTTSFVTTTTVPLTTTSFEEYQPVLSFRSG